VQRRNERRFERFLLKQAKAKFYKLYGKNRALDRAKIRKFKNEFREKFEKGNGGRGKRF
jgi:hypothetical protein